MKNIFILLAGLMVLTGCETLSNLGSNQKDNQSIDSSSQTQPRGFADFTDIPIPNGAKMSLSNSLVFGGNDEWTGQVTKTTSMAAAETYDFYLTQMPGYGWTKITGVRSKTSVMTYVRGDRIATITIEPRSITGSEIIFTVSPREYGPATPQQKR